MGVWRCSFAFMKFKNILRNVAFSAVLMVYCWCSGFKHKPLSNGCRRLLLSPQHYCPAVPRALEDSCLQKKPANTYACCQLEGESTSLEMVQVERIW